MRSIGIDISKNGLAVVEVSSDRSSYEILRGYFHPCQRPEDSDWDIEVLQILKQLSKDYDFANTSVTVGLSQHRASVRNLNFPFKKRSDIIKSLPFELDEELPMDLDDAIFDAKIIAVGSAETSVVAFAAPVEDIQNILTLLEKINLDPDIISIESAAFANLFENWHDGSFLTAPPEQTAAPMELRVLFRKETSLLALFQGRQMIWARNISWGENNIINHLVSSFNLPHQKAAELIPDKTPLLINTKEANQDTRQVAKVMEKAFVELLNTLKLSLIDVENQFGGSVQTIGLFGPISGIANIAAYCTQHLHVPFTTHTLANDVFQPHQVRAIAHFSEQAPIAVGLALEGLKKPKNPPVNFRKGDCAKKNKFFERTWEKWGYTTLLCSLAYISFIAYGFVREQITIGLDDKSYQILAQHAGTIAGLKGPSATPVNIARFIEKEEEKMNNKKFFDQVQDIEPSMKIINQISIILPPNNRNIYDIKRLDADLASVVIEGEAESAQTVKLIENKLKLMSLDKRVYPLKPTIKKNKGVVFAYKFRHKG